MGSAIKEEIISLAEAKYIDGECEMSYEIKGFLFYFMNFN